MPKTTMDDAHSGWRFSRTVSLDSVIVLTVTILSGMIFVFTTLNKIDQQAHDLTNMQKLVERVEADQKERSARVERDQAERYNRLESAIKDQSAVIQTILLPQLKR